jgi:TPR repeat protein
MLASLLTNDESFVWAQKAAAQRNRRGLYQLGLCHVRAVGCARDERKATELCKAAADLGFPAALYHYGKRAYSATDWERYHWQGLAVSRGFAAEFFVDHVLDLLRAFEMGGECRILHTAAPVIAEHLRVNEQSVFWKRIGRTKMERIRRILVLHDEMLQRAREAIDCWSMAARRCGVVKDMRVMIAKMAWQEPWRWCARSSAPARGQRLS